MAAHTPANDKTMKFSTPGWGYIIQTRAQTSVFRNLGESFVLSNVTDLEPDPGNAQLILWAGPDPNPEVSSMLLIWPSRKAVYSLPTFTQTNQSVVIDLRLDIMLKMKCEPQNVMVEELLYFGRVPCILLFCNPDKDREAAEITSLSFTKCVSDTVHNLLEFLESRKKAGDAFESSLLLEWYKKATTGKEEPITIFNFNKMVGRVLLNMGNYVRDMHHFDLDQKELILVPMIFVRNWAAKFGAMLKLEWGEKDVVMSELGKDPLLPKERSPEELRRDDLMAELIYGKGK